MAIIVPAPERITDPLVVACVTPFNEYGELDVTKQKRFYDYLIREGAVPLVRGTTGESPTVYSDETQLSIRNARDVSNGRTYIWACVGGNSPKEVEEESEAAVECGARILLLTDPYYNDPSSPEIRHNHHGYIAKWLREKYPELIQLVPYIIPGRVGTATEPLDLYKLAKENENIRAVKEARGEAGLPQIIEERKYLDALKDIFFSIKSGDDSLTAWYRTKEGIKLPGIMTDPRIRGDGVVSVIGDLIPYGVNQMAKTINEGRYEEAKELWYIMEPLFKIVTISVPYPRTLPDGTTKEITTKFKNPVPIKELLMRGLGIDLGTCREPLGITHFEDPEDIKIAKAGAQIARKAALESYEREVKVSKELELDIRILRRLETEWEGYVGKVEDRVKDPELWDTLVTPKE